MASKNSNRTARRLKRHLGSSSKSVLVALAALGLAGCGAEHRAAPQPPRLPHALGTRLAAQADAIRVQLERGDDCAAARMAAGLQSDVITAVNTHRVPRRLQETLVGSVSGLAGRIVCVPPPTEPANKHGKTKKHGKKGHGGEGND